MVTWILVAVICFGEPGRMDCSTHAVAPFSTEQACVANANRTARGYLRVFKKRQASNPLNFCIPFGDLA